MVDLSVRPLAPAGLWPRREEDERRGVRTGLRAALDAPGFAPESALFGVPEWAPRRVPRNGILALHRAGWLAAVVFHAALAAALLGGIPLKAPEAWPADVAMVTLIFERPVASAPSEGSSVPTLAAPAPIEEPPPVAVAATEPPPEAAEVPPPEIVEPPAPAPPVAAVEPEPALPPPPEPVPLPRPKPVRAAASKPVAKPVPVRPAPAEMASSATGPAEPHAAPVAEAPPPQTAALPILPPRPVGFGAGNRKPDYPAEARRRGVQGEVVLRVEVSADGRPGEISVLTSSGHALLDQAALATVRGWRFQPATRGGVAVAAPADVPLRFRLQD